MKFTKMHGCGNDYIYVNGYKEQIAADRKPELVRRLSDRHFGIGGDGVIFINPGKSASFEMEMYNADGTRAQMCGNGIRCVAKYVYDYGLTDQTSITIESFGQVKHLDLTLGADGKVETVRVNMGAPVLTASEIPVVSDHEQVIDEEIEVDGQRYRMTCVSMGNPSFRASRALPRAGQHGICAGHRQKYGADACLGAGNWRDACLWNRVLCNGCCLCAEWSDRQQSDGQGAWRRDSVRVGPV